MIFGYARVSTNDQNLNLQLDALKKFGCEKIFEEKTSGAKISRIELNNLLNSVRPGDTIVVWKLDRLGRSTKDLITIVNQLSIKKIEFVSLHDNINTSTAQGRFFFHVIASFVELERELIRERTNAGLEAAKARGRFGGRPKGLSNDSLQKMKTIHSLYKQNHSINEIIKIVKVSRSTAYRFLKNFNNQ